MRLPASVLSRRKKKRFMISRSFSFASWAKRRVVLRAGDNGQAPRTAIEAARSRALHIGNGWVIRPHL